MTGVAFRAGREALGFSRTEMAALLSVHYNTIVVWERRARLKPFQAFALKGALAARDLRARYSIPADDDGDVEVVAHLVDELRGPGVTTSSSK